MSNDYPKLRDLEAFPYSERGRHLIMLRDPSHLAEGIVVVEPEIYSILPLLNGKNSLLDIQAALTRKRGEIVFRENIEDLLRHLDKAYFLDNENFRRHRKEVVEGFRVRKTRPAFHAGVSYPSDLSDLVDQINKFYVGEKGAGLPDQPTGSRVRALVAPHIDLRMGGPVYTHAYRALAEGKRPELFVIMGTCHSPLSQLFSLSSKEFETPFGTARLDREFYQALRGEFGSSHFLEDLSHRSEHTIEFQLLFLQHLYQKSEIMILPILASFSFRELQKAESRELFWKFVQGLKSVEQKSGTEVCYIASVDLAHMGPRYGDSFQPDDRFIEETSRKDLEMLDYVHSIDPHGFLDYIRSEEDRRRICGFPPIYTILNLLDDVEGKLLCHSHSRMDGMGSFVTYASMVFTDHSCPGDSDNSD